MLSDCEELVGHLDRNDTSYLFIEGGSLVTSWSSASRLILQSFSLEPLCGTTLLAGSERAQQPWRSFTTPCSATQTPKKPNDSNIKP